MSNRRMLRLRRIVWRGQATEPSPFFGGVAQMIAQTRSARPDFPQENDDAG
jgi:hypothetical protein